ncbi:MAG: glycosyltransferase [Nitrospira sp.]|nr:glycosyltransferase [Nitrospira sp.]
MTLACPRRYQLVSVIIPVYNAAATLGQQLKALKGQEFDGNWEIVAVDNQSTDDSATVIRQYQQQMPQLRFVQATDKQTAAYARNVGARAAKGDAFLFCDADDVVAPGWLAAMADALEQHDFVAGTMDLELLNESKAWRGESCNWATRRNLSFLPFSGGALLGISREAFERVGGFNEEAPIGEDVELSWRLQLHGYPLHPVTAATIHVRCRETRQGMWKQYVRYGEAHVYLYKQFASSGMPRPSVKKAVCNYWGLISTIPYLLREDERQRAQFVRKAAICWGRLCGSLRYRKIYV